MSKMCLKSFLLSESVQNRIFCLKFKCLKFNSLKFLVIDVNSAVSYIS